MQTNTSNFINLEAFAQAAAEHCGLTRDSFKKKVVRDRLRKVRLDKCWRFDIADLNEWIDSRKEEIARETEA